MHILVADHHHLFREALVSYIERAKIATVISVATDLIALQDHLARKGPLDIVLVSDQLPDLTGVEEICELIRRWAAIRFVVLSESQSQQDRAQFIKCGLWGFFPRSMPGRAMIDALQDIISGKKYLGSVSRQLYEAAHQRASAEFFTGRARGFGPQPELRTLTGRELDVLACLADGVSNAEIAASLGIQLVTVKLHMRNLTRKLGARNRTEAALIARRLGVGRVQTRR